jgi:anti-sigma factor RsiW
VSDIHALSGAYAVDALDDIERAQFERHLAGCEACRNEVDSLREAAAMLPETTSVSPPPALRDRVLADIATVRPLPPLVTPTGDPGRTRRRWVTGLVAAAAAVVALVGGGIVYDVVNDDASSQNLSAVDQVLQARDAERFTNTFPGGVEATVVRSRSLDRAVLVADGMPAAPSGRAYALWLQNGNVMVPAGIMSGTDDPAHGVLLRGEAASAQGAGVTIEAAGTSPTTPSEEVVALFDFEQG